LYPVQHALVTESSRNIETPAVSPSQYAPVHVELRYVVPGFGFDPTVNEGANRTLRESYGQPPELVKHGAPSPIGEEP
jgi:hypothetical protein